MQRYAEKRRSGLRPAKHRPPGRLQVRDRLHPRDNRPANGTYRDAVASSKLDPEVARAKFAAAVDRALRHARAAGLTDKQIYEKTGVSTSTFHRWRTQQIRELPDLDKGRHFFRELDDNVDEGLAAFGMSESTTLATTAEPPLPEDVRIILRKLADPNIDEERKAVIRAMLQMLAEQAEGRVSTSRKRANSPAADA